MAKFFGLDKIRAFFEIIKFHGGIRSTLYKMYRMDDLPIGTLVGADKFGNKYFENKNYMIGRNRWVEYSPSVGTDYDGSQVPPEWFGWLHHKTDLLPSEADRVNHSWIAEWEPNMTGTNKQYVPYSTTKPKVEGWVPGNKKQPLI